MTLSDSGGLGFPKASVGPCEVARLPEVGAEWDDLGRAVLELMLPVGVGVTHSWVSGTHLSSDRKLLKTYSCPWKLPSPCLTRLVYHPSLK